MRIHLRRRCASHADAAWARYSNEHTSVQIDDDTARRVRGLYPAQPCGLPIVCFFSAHQLRRSRTLNKYMRRRRNRADSEAQFLAYINPNYSRFEIIKNSSVSRSSWPTELAARVRGWVPKGKPGRVIRTRICARRYKRDRRRSRRVLYLKIGSGKVKIINAHCIMCVRVLGAERRKVH